MSDQVNDLLKTHRIKSLFAEFSTSHDYLPIEVRNEVIMSLVNKKLQDKSAVVELDEANELVLKQKDGANVFGDDHRQWDMKTLIRHALADNKILKEEKEPAATTPVVNTKLVANQPAQTTKKNTLKTLVDRSLQDLEKSYRH